MTAAERCRAAWSNLPTDRPSVQPICMSFAARDAGARFFEYAKDHRTLAGCQIHVAETYEFDCVSMTSDPCREAHDLGQEILWFQDEPPMPDPDRPLLGDERALDRLELPDPTKGRMGECLAGIALLKSTQSRPVLGWVEGPIAEAADLRGLPQVMEDLIDHPDLIERLFSFVVQMELRYAAAQVDAGADIIGIGDAAASLVGPVLYERHVWPFEKRLVDGIHALGVPVRLHICGNTTHLFAGFDRLGVQMVDVDCVADLAEAKRQLGDRVAILGNLDPVADVQRGTPTSIVQALAKHHSTVGRRFVVGAGCELPPDTPPANVAALAEYAKNPQIVANC